MCLLAKIPAQAMGEDVLDIAYQKSERDIGERDIGSRVFLWVTDSDLGPGHLAGVGRLASVERVQIPQVRNPRHMKDAYRIALSDVVSPPARALSTDDLAHLRDVPDDSPMRTLGNLHKDRNTKIKRMTAEAVALLDASFDGVAP